MQSTKLSPDPLTIAIGKELRATREWQGLSCEQAAKRIGIPSNTLNCYETGRRAASVVQLDMLCRALGLSLPRLLEKASMRARGPGVGVTLRTEDGDVVTYTVHDVSAISINGVPMISTGRH